MQLEGRVALVTGGGRGIGRGIVERFLEEGACVVVMQRSGLDHELSQDPRVAGIEADLADPEAISRGVDQAAERFGGIDIVVNNAGVMFERSPSEIRLSEWQLMATVNLQAPLLIVQAALRYLPAGGSIINIGSIEGVGANPQHAAYCATKAGVHGMTRALAVDLGASGIRCNAIAPGWIDSDLSEQYLNSRADPVSAREELERLHPIGRTGRPADVGSLAVFLASDHAAFLTGEIITLDGGRTAMLPNPR
ncbi:MAG TPA: SDR family oxidoreductase [Beutenbergiaceae bacterium]|nr:SDR family oxidoreductase [Beutenbergiaceae bacterium]